MEIEDAVAIGGACFVNLDRTRPGIVYFDKVQGIEGSSWILHRPAGKILVLCRKLLKIYAEHEPPRADVFRPYHDPSFVDQWPLGTIQNYASPEILTEERQIPLRNEFDIRCVTTS